LAMARNLHQLQIRVHTVIVNHPSLNQVYPSSGYSKELITIRDYGLAAEYHELFVMSMSPSLIKFL